MREHGKLIGSCGECIPPHLQVLRAEVEALRASVGETAAAGSGQVAQQLQPLWRIPTAAVS